MVEAPIPHPIAASTREAKGVGVGVEEGEEGVGLLLGPGEEKEEEEEEEAAPPPTPPPSLASFPDLSSPKEAILGAPSEKARMRERMHSA